MKQVIDTLVPILRSARKNAFLGVGSPLRGDDAAGLHIVQKLEAALNPGPTQEFRFHLGEAAPENFTGAIREFAPDHLFIFDAANLQRNPGEFKIIPPEEIAGAGFSTHMLPLKIVIDYLVISVGCGVTVVGVQPQNLEFSETLSLEVESAVDQFTASLCQRFAE